MAWLAIAASMTVRATRKGLPFGLTWWSFTFPVGTCVTGTIGLAARTGADLLRYGAAGLFLLLLAAWLIVAVRTVRDGARGRLFLPAPHPSRPNRSRSCRSRREAPASAPDPRAVLPGRPENPRPRSEERSLSRTGAWILRQLSAGRAGRAERAAGFWLARVGSPAAVASAGVLRVERLR